MRQRTVKAQRVLRYTTEATLKDLDKYTGTKPCELMEEAKRIGYKTLEPQIWQYIGCEPNPDKIFTLEIMLPIQGEGNGLKPNNFEIVDIPAFKCVSELHEGEWKEMGNTYGKIMNYCKDNNFQYNGLCREVYVHCDFEEHSNCITDVQMGIM